MATINVGGGVGARQPEAVEKGINVAICKVSLSVTISAGDIHRIGKLPHGAIPVDAIFYPGSSINGISTGPALKFGTSASNELFFASTSYSVATASLVRCSRPLGLAQQVSLSDDFMPRYENIVMVGSAGGAGVGSVGYFGDLIVFYKMPGQTQ